MSSVTIEELLRGTTFGSRQSVGVMEIIPILGDDNDDFAPPDVSVSTRDYGTVVLGNESGLPTIVPTGAGWVVKQAAQDHAIGGAIFLAKEQVRSINTAACIQSSQSGYISPGKHEMLVLPASLRSAALATRRERGYNKLWNSIGEFNRNMGIAEYGKHLEYFLDSYKKTLDEFVAEFEVVPNMLGAIILINGTVVGIEMGPNADYWLYVWKPLIRVCYGSLAIEVSRASTVAPKTRAPFTSKARTIAGLLKSLEKANLAEAATTKAIVASVVKHSLTLATSPDEQMGNYQLTAVADSNYSGQVVCTPAFSSAYISICSTNTER
jgi:hypothetical protein